MMKRLLVALLATSTMALAAPAFAHPEHPEAPGADESWNNGGASYGDFNQEYQHIWEGIQRPQRRLLHARPGAEVLRRDAANPRPG
jgi:hypothetical protein